MLRNQLISGFELAQIWSTNLGSYAFVTHLSDRVAPTTSRDAKIGAASCLVNNSFLNLNSNPTRAREWFAESTAILNEALAAAPENPRLLWVQGANQWFAPPERGGGREVAMATYEKRTRARPPSEGARHRLLRANVG
jgi:hypothetical protein